MHHPDILSHDWSYSMLAVTEDVNDVIHGYYGALPEEYSVGNSRFPVLIFIHGGGGFCNGVSDLPKLLDEGVPRLLVEKKFPPAFVTAAGNFSFIILIPQLSRFPVPADVKSFINYAIARYRIDSQRVYITGMSLGGRFACDFSAVYPRSVAAVVAMSGVCDTTNMSGKCAAIAAGDLPLWLFHNKDDQVFSAALPKAFADEINVFKPAYQPRLTILGSMGVQGHDSWTRATDPTFRTDGENIYEWMLQFKRPAN